MRGQPSRALTWAYPKMRARSPACRTRIHGRHLALWQAPSMAAPGRPRFDDLAFVHAADQLAEDHAHELGFVPRLFAQTSLPYRDPGDVREWQRHNGSLTLTV